MVSYKYTNSLTQLTKILSLIHICYICIHANDKTHRIAHNAFVVTSHERKRCVISLIPPSNNLNETEIFLFTRSQGREILRDL